MSAQLIAKDRAPIGLGLILMIAAAFRLIHLGQRDFWYDEAFTGIVVREPLANMMRMLIHDVHPPLYYLGAKLCSSFFAYSVFGIRFYSVVFGLLSIVMVYRLTAMLFHVSAARWAALLASIAPFAIQYAQEARMYSQLSFLILAATYFLFRSLRARRNIFPLLWGTMLGLAMLTHYLAILFIPVFGGIILLEKWKRGHQPIVDPPATMSARRNFLIGLAVCLLLFSPWAGSALQQWHTSGPGLRWITKPTPVDLGHALQSFVLGAPPGNMTQGEIAPTSRLGHVPQAVTLALTIITILIGTVTVIAKNAKHGATLTLLFTGPILLLYGASFFGYDYFVTRYLLPSAFFLYLVLGVAVAGLARQFRYLLLAVSIVGLASIQTSALPTGWNALQRNLPRYAGRSFFVLNPFDYVLAKYYLGADRVILYNAERPNDRPASWPAIGETLRSTANRTDLVGAQHYLLTYLPLGSPASTPRTLTPLTFTLVDRYDRLFVYRAEE